jgi:hypothetical protein
VTGTLGVVVIGGCVVAGCFSVVVTDGTIGVVTTGGRVISGILGVVTAGGHSLEVATGISVDVVIGSRSVVVT